MDNSLASQLIPLKPVSSEPLIRRANISDATRIFELYNRIYSGKYTDPALSSVDELRKALSERDYFWMVGEFENKIVGSVIYRFDRVNCLAKVYGAVVDPQFRRHNLAERLMSVGYIQLREEYPPVEVVYATTRTLSPAPQRMTKKLGYKKLGIFPNVHKNEGYETHCLTALFAGDALKRRFTDFSLHPSVSPLYAIAAQECELPPLPTASDESIAAARRPQVSTSSAKLESIEASEFVRHRFNSEKQEQGYNWFYPFHEPNLLFTTPNQRVEVFCYLSAKDRHCVVIGIQDLDSMGYFAILESVSQLLRELGARYIEFIMPADAIGKIDQAIQAEFIPCGYFPAMHDHDGFRHDCVVFSRSFETLNFKNIALDGVNKKYLSAYFKRWKEQSAPDIDTE